MTKRCPWLLTSALAVAACRGGGVERAGDSTGMSAAEHARMLAADSAVSGARGPVHLTGDQGRAIGITYTTATRGPLARTVRTVGQVVVPEPNLAEITVKVEGFVEELFADAVGAPVRRGQPLLTIYSPMLVAAEQELITALRLAAALDSFGPDPARSARDLVAAARRRLANWDISPDQIERLERTSEITKTLTLRAPFSGTVLEKMVVKGQGVMPGMKLYRLADLSTVWIEGQVFEQDLSALRLGAEARVQVTGYPDRDFRGRVSFIYPTVDQQSRTGRIRIALGNPGGALKPGMYATLLLEVASPREVVSLPAEAVVMTGERNLVFVAAADGALVPREVLLGARAGDRIEILRGLAAGERVVASAGFLVDAESRLATGSGMGAMPGMNLEPPKREKRP